MEDQGQGAAVAAGVAAAATTVAEATPHAAAEDPRSTPLAIAVPVLAPKALHSSHLFGGGREPFFFFLQSLHITNPICFNPPPSWFVRPL